MFVLSLLAFFVIHLQLDSLSDQIDPAQPRSGDGPTATPFRTPTAKPKYANNNSKQQLAQLDRARASLPDVAKPIWTWPSRKCVRRPINDCLCLAQRPYQPPRKHRPDGVVIND